MKTYEIVWNDGRNFFCDELEFESEEYLVDYIKSELKEYECEEIEVALHSVTEIERTPIELENLGL